MVQPKSNKCPSLLLISYPCSPARRCSISGFCPAMSWVVHKFFTPHRVQQGMARFFTWHAMLADTDRQRWLLLICKPRMGSPSHSLVITSIIWYVGVSINEYKWGYPQFSPFWIGFSIINHPAIGVPPFSEAVVTSPQEPPGWMEGPSPPWCGLLRSAL